MEGFGGDLVCLVFCELLVTFWFKYGFFDVFFVCVCRVF